MENQSIAIIILLYAGIKFVPLRIPGGELIPGSGLFVKVKKFTESKEKTSGEVQNENVHRPPVRRRICRQVSFNLDDGSIEDFKSITKEEEERDDNSEADDEDSKMDKSEIDDIEIQDRPRLSTCPASFQSLSDRKSRVELSSNRNLRLPRLATVAEVHGDETES